MKFHFPGFFCLTFVLSLELEDEIQELQKRSSSSPAAFDGDTSMLLRANQAEENLVVALNQVSNPHQLKIENKCTHPPTNTKDPRAEAKDH